MQAWVRVKLGRDRRRASEGNRGFRDKVNRIVREQALGYVTGYLEGGNQRLAVYRDAGRPTFVAQEFASMIDRMPSLTEYLPDLKRYLLDYPKTTLPHADSFLYWQNAKFAADHSNQSSDDYRTADSPIVVRNVTPATTGRPSNCVLVPDPAHPDGFWFASVNRSRSDD
jgi:hypothetical protein